MNAQTVTSSTFVEPRFILKGVSWQTFKALMAEVGDDRAWRIAYDEGVLELRMPLTEHEDSPSLTSSTLLAIVDET